MKFKKIYIEITNVCNLNCSFCAKNKRPSQFMSQQQFAYILNEIRPFTKYIYLHVLGEPMLHPELSDLLALAKQNGFFVNMTSNGTLLPGHLQELKGKIRQLNLSLHSLPKETGCHSEHYLQDCLAYGDELAEAGTYVSYRFWNQREGKMDEESMEMIHQIGKYYNKQIAHDVNQKLAPRRFLHFEEQFVWPSLATATIATEGSCYGMRNQCAILVDGSVIPCCLDSLGDCTLGNLYEQSFSDILQQPRVQAMVAGFQHGILQEPLCQRCGFRKRFDQEEQV